MDMDPLLSVSPTISSSATLHSSESHWTSTTTNNNTTSHLEPTFDTPKRTIRPRTEVVEPNPIPTSSSPTPPPQLRLWSNFAHSLTLPFSIHNRHHLLCIALLCGSICHFLLFSWYTHMIITLAVVSIGAAAYSAYLYLTHYGALYFLPPFLVDFLTHYSLLDISQMSWSSGITSDLICLFLFSLTPEEQDVIIARLPYELQRLLRKRGIIQFLPSSLHHLIGLDQLQKIHEEQIRHQLEQEATSPIMRVPRTFPHSSSHPSLLAFHQHSLQQPLTTSRSHPTRMYAMDQFSLNEQKYDSMDDISEITEDITEDMEMEESHPINITTLLDRSVKNTIQSVVNNNSTIDYVHQAICNTGISFLPKSLRGLVNHEYPISPSEFLSRIPFRLITCTSLFTFTLHLLLSRNARHLVKNVATTGMEISLYVTATVALTGMFYQSNNTETTTHNNNERPSSRNSTSHAITRPSASFASRLTQFMLRHKFSFGSFMMIAWVLFLKRKHIH